MKPTVSQKKAIETIDKNVSVSAGAGSGKTRVLVERYINILDNGSLEYGKEVESIVAITFTKKAAAEMKERVRQSVHSLVRKDKKWNRIYKDLEKAQISTIHSFCSKILRENPIEGNLDPNFSLLDDHENDKLLVEVIEDIITEGIENRDDIYKFIEYFTSDSLNSSSFSDGIIDSIKNIYKEVRSTGMSFTDLKEITINYIDSLDCDISVVKDIKEKINFLAENITRKNSKIQQLNKDSRWIDFNSRDILEIDSKVIDDISYFSSRLGTNKKYQDIIDEIIELSSNLLILEEKNKKYIYEIFIDLLIDIDRDYTNKKEEIGSLDYEDLQIKLLNLLDNSDLVKRYQNKFKYIMVDEFQDTNELQRKIIYKLCSVENKLDRQNLFVVGDPKQSIYGFRGADIDVFYDVVNDIEETSNIETISLKDNFRTADNVMKFINNVFNKLMGKRYEELKANKDSINDIDVEIIEDNNIEVPGDVDKGEFIKKYEAELIAKKIRKLVKEEDYSYKDIALLFRSMTDTYIYEEAFKEYGIPFYNLGGKGFYKREEIIDILNALKTINNKYDTLSLVATLRSPMFGVSDTTIYWVMKEYKNDILNNLNKDIKNITDSEKKKLNNAYTILNRLNKIKGTITIHELIEEILDSTYYIETWMLKFGGKQAMANIYKFMDMARRFIERENNSLDNFIDFIEKQSDEIDEGQAQIETEEGNTVKLMTIHKSKGLQFKVVVIPQMAKQFNFRYPNILFDKNIGIAIKHPDNLGKLDESISPLYSKLLDDQKEKDMEENKRVLYVAMTRTEEKLIIGNQSDKRLRSSFKKMIKDYIDTDNSIKVGDINVEKDSIKRVANLKKDIKEMPLDKDKFPILKDFNQYGARQFNTFSISQYMTFNKCRRKFYMSYYKRIPIEEIEIQEEVLDYNKGNNNILDPIKKGLIVHQVCENYDNERDIDSLIEKSIVLHQVNPTDDITKEIKKYVNNYANFYKNDYDKFYNEKKFYYKLGDKYIYGIIDRINIRNNRAEIIDFKTNRVTNKDLIKNNYKNQIQIYTKAFKDIYNIEISRAGLLMLETGEFIDIDISEENLDKNIKSIKEFINFVTNNKDIKDYPKNECNCSYCDFKDFCI